VRNGFHCPRARTRRKNLPKRFSPLLEDDSSAGEYRYSASMRIFFLCPADWYFRLHRLGLARAIRDTHAQVFIMAQVTRDEDFLRQEGYQVIPWQIVRSSLNPFRELWAFYQVYRAYREIKPDLVHHFAVKAIVHGGLAARLCEKLPSVNSIAGLGHVFIVQSPGMRILKRFVLYLLRVALGATNARTIFENKDDLDLLAAAHAVAPERAVVIPGVGVNPLEFSPHAEPDSAPLVLLASRMLWTKGVGEYVRAAEILKKAGIRGRFALAGMPDPGNPASIPASQLRAWADEGFVEWWGQRDDMPMTFAQAHIVCLPSYREGVPRALIEAAACGRAVVATDVPGCREVVRHGENGLLVPPRDPRALAEAIATLVKDPALRARMGARGREIAVQEFSEERVVRETLALYSELLGAKWPTAACGPES
jgi:glycosyltransferase involved in cell wall biosynthesis